MTDFITQDLSEINVIFIHSSLDDSGLSANEFRIYAHLARRSNKKGKAWPGIDSMAQVCQMHKETVTIAIKALESRNMLRVERRKGMGNVYSLTPPSLWHQSEIGNGANQSESGNGVVGNGELHQSESGNVSISIEGNPQKEIQPQSLPSVVSVAVKAEQVFRLSELFDRRGRTSWQDKEVKALAKLQPLSLDDLTLVEAYYASERSKPRGIHRRDLATLLNNWQGEVDRAKQFAAKQKPSHENESAF